MERPRFRRAAAAPTRPAPPSLAERLEEWLVLWGDWVRAYRPNAEINKGLSATAFKDTPSSRQWQSTLDVLEEMRLEERTLRELDACISDLIRAHYLVLHWQYARAYKARQVQRQVFEHGQLPHEGTPAYESLLDAARASLATVVVRRRVIIPE